MNHEELLYKIKFLIENQEMLIRQICDLGYSVEKAQFNFGAIEGIKQVRALILQDQQCKCKKQF